MARSQTFSEFSQKLESNTMTKLESFVKGERERGPMQRRYDSGCDLGNCLLEGSNEDFDCMKILIIFSQEEL